MHSTNGSVRRRMPIVALVGRPNVGKSTLFNRLTRSRDALVAELPGLTRDRRYGRCLLDTMWVELVDTGGIEPQAGEDSVSRQAYLQGIQAVREADLILFLVDARDGITAVDKEVFDLLRPFGKPLIVVANKVDGPRQEDLVVEFHALGVEEVVPVSAEHGRGVAELAERIEAVCRELGGAEDNREPVTEPEEERPIRVSILGRPNVGKSSLFNRLAGAPRMIVTDIPGTTRDAIDTLIRRPGHRDILLTDTAGIRRRARVEDKVEKFSVLKAIDAVKTCDVVLLVLDATEGVTDQDKRLLGYGEEYGRAVMTIYNKWDLVQRDRNLARLRTEELERAKRFMPHAPHVNVSALTGGNVGTILPIVEELAAQFHATFPTGRVNRVLARAMSARTPPFFRGHHVRLFYATQVATGPPTFLVFANYPQHVPAYYERFLVKQFRRELGIPHTPVRFVFRGRDRDSEEGAEIPTGSVAEKRDRERT